MSNSDAIPSLAALSLEAFPSGDAVRRRAAEFTMRKRLSGATVDELEAIGAAAERLIDPVGRFEESMSWLILPVGTVKRVIDASETWPQRMVEFRAAVARDSAPECKLHNEVVLAGLACLVDPNRQTVNGAVDTIAELSTEVVGQTPFWEMVLRNALAIDDPRLNWATVEASKGAYQTRALRLVLAPIEAELRRFQTASACAALAAISATKLPEKVLSEVRMQLFGDIVQRCEHSIAELEPRAEVTKTKASHEEVLRTACNQLDRDISSLCELGDAGGESCRRVRDAYAELMRTLAIRGVNVYGMHAEAESITARAHAAASSSGLRTRLIGDQAALAGNAESSKCVFCKSANANGTPKSVRMFRITRLQTGSVSDQSVDIPVARCKGCQKKHARFEKSMQTMHGVFFVGGVLAGIGVGVSVGLFMKNSEGGEMGALGGAVVGAILGFIAAGLLGTAVESRFAFTEKGQSSHSKPIKELLAQGWQFGEKLGKGD